jgi:hypothetical protein
MTASEDLCFDLGRFLVVHYLLCSVCIFQQAKSGNIELTFRYFSSYIYNICTVVRERTQQNIQELQTKPRVVSLPFYLFLIN